MVKYEDILNFEIMRFKQDYNITNYSEKDAMRLLRVALADALAYAARRKKVKYADNANSICQTMLKKINEEIDNKNFKDIFDDLVEKFQKNEHLTRFREIGYALKFSSMVFKYFYCFDDIREKYGDKFDECCLPLDSNTLNWYEKKFGEKCSVWSELEKKIYEDIQLKIKNEIKNKKLAYEYKLIDLKQKKIETINCLPKNRLDLEFIMWNQEKYKVGYRK